MRAYATEVGLRKVAIIAKNLESVLRKIVYLQPSVNVWAAKSFVLAMAGTIVVLVVDTQKTPIINPATCAFTSVRFDHFLSKFGAMPAVNGFGRFRVFFAPCFGVRSISLFILVVMLQIVRTVARFLSALSFFRFQFFAHI